MRLVHVLAFSLGLASLLTAQRGSYTTFGTGCQSRGNQPVISSTGVPAIGRTFSVDLSGAAAFSPAFLSLAASNRQWGPLKLPLDLSALGAPGCLLLTSLETLAPAVATATGTASVMLTVPNDRGLVNAVLHNQWIVLDLTANALGMVFSNGGTATIGA